jgi:hypothetical protein
MGGGGKIPLIPDFGKRLKEVIILRLKPFFSRKSV